MSARFPLRATTLCLAFALAGAAPVGAQTPAAPAAAAHPHAAQGQKPAEKPKPPEPAEQPADHDQHVHASGDERSPDLPAFIPRLTDEDREAAFPDVAGHTVHDEAIHFFALFDQLEWQTAGSGGRFNIDSKGWIGTDRDRFWFRAEADSQDGRVGDAQAHALFGRQFSRWWDIVAGVRQDVRPGPAQTWFAIGVQGLAPYWFEVEATGYVGAAGRTQARFEVEYELLLTNRVILQPLIEVELFGKSDPARGIGAGLSTTDAGLRLRYEIRREFAPYIGVVWRNQWGATADFAEAAGDPAGGARLVSGLRFWF